VAWPSERIQLGSDDPTVAAIEWLTPFGKGSRVVIAGPSRSGKSEALRRLAGALVARSELEVSAVLIGVRPEEIADFPVTPGSALTFSASVDAQAQAVEQAVEVGRRVAARGGDAIVLIDSLEYLAPSAARRALAAGRNLAGGGSLTVIATSPVPVGGETTVVTLDLALAATGSFPALAVGASGTLRPELLVGQAGTDAIRAAASGGAVPSAPVVIPEPPVAAPAPSAPVVVPEPVVEPEPVVAAKPVAVVESVPAAKPGRSRSRAAKPAAAKPAAKKPAARKRAAAKPAAAKPAAKRAAAAKSAAAKPAAAKRKPAARKRAPKRAAE
jgi:transcription termination factor Rho